MKNLRIASPDYQKTSKIRQTVIFTSQDNRQWIGRCDDSKYLISRHNAENIYLIFTMPHTNIDSSNGKTLCVFCQVVSLEQIIYDVYAI